MKLPSWLVQTIKEFKAKNKRYSKPCEAESNCWEVSTDFYQHLKHIALEQGSTSNIIKVCFNRQCVGRGRCTSDGYGEVGHSHNVTFLFPFELTRLPKYEADHRFNHVVLPDHKSAINIDFTARQFNAKLSFPLVWERGTNTPITIR